MFLPDREDHPHPHHWVGFCLGMFGGAVLISVGLRMAPPVPRLAPVPPVMHPLPLTPPEAAPFPSA